MSNLNLLRSDLKSLANPEKAAVMQRFFKTGKGEYGEGDIFMGITVPKQRKVAKKYFNLSFNEISLLLSSKIHEERLIALLMLVDNFRKNEKSKLEQRKIFEFYLSQTKNINSWDLVDTSASYIIGEYLSDKDKTILYSLARSENTWEKRISIIATFHFIKNRQFKDTIKLSEILLNDKHDMVHKAVGWMLREIGKRNSHVLETFLLQHYKEMPRTMLRYAIEKFPEEKRKRYLKGKINRPMEL